MANSWSRMLAVTATAVGAGFLIYYLLSDKPLFYSEPTSPPKPKSQQMTKNDCIDLLKEIVQSQEETKAVLKKLTVELMGKPSSLEQVYAKAIQMQPSDPMESWGLSVVDLDQLIEKYQNDPLVKEYIMKIMNSPILNDASLTEEVRRITIEQLIQVHEYMLSQLELVIKEFKSLPNKQSMEVKTLTLAAQAIVAAKVEEKFKLSSDQVESAVIINHAELTANQAFSRLTMQMQTEMNELIG